MMTITAAHARTESPSEAITAIMGYDPTCRARQHTFRKLHRARASMPSSCPAIATSHKIVRYERLIKRNLYRALYTLERMRATRTRPDPSDSTAFCHLV